MSEFQVNVLFKRGNIKSKVLYVFFSLNVRNKILSIGIRITFKLWLFIAFKNDNSQSDDKSFKIYLLETFKNEIFT